METNETAPAVEQREQSGPGPMSHEIEASDPLASEIGELREELLLWIETELTRLHQQVEDLAKEETRTASSSPDSTAPGSLPMAARRNQRSRPELSPGEGFAALKR